jgi:putative hydrolase of HD superfamily
MTTSTQLTGLVSLLRQANAMKHIPRMGWLLRGIATANAESVAEHTFGVAITALLLADFVDEPLDQGRLLTMCLLHDLPETVITDLVPMAVQYLSPAGKHDAEKRALSDLLRGAPSEERLKSLWQEYALGSSQEARLARDADKLEMVIHAAALERAGWRALDEFWESASLHSWEFAISARVFHHLSENRARHSATGAGPS